MDAIVTARVPVEVKEQGNAILKEIGSSPTKLINAAYEYVLRYHSLPQVVVEYMPESHERYDEDGRVIKVVTKEALKEVEEMMERCSFPEPSGGWDTRDYKEIIAEGRWADYEALG